MLANKRTQIRTNLRKTEILHHLALKRRELVHGKQGLAQELFQEVNQQAQGLTNIHLVGKLLAYHKQNPLQENTYVLISNYLLEQPQDLRYFYHTLVSQPRYLQHYMWCLSVMAMSLHSILYTNERVEVFAAKQQMGELMESANKVVSELLVNLKSNNQKSDRDIKMWQYYMQMLKLVLQTQLFEEFPSRAVQLFAGVASHFNLHQTQHQVLVHTWKCMTTIIENHNKRLQNHLRQSIMKQCAQMSQFVLRQIPLARLQCIQLLYTILGDFPVDFMCLVYSQLLMKQILFLLKQMPSLRSASTRLIKFIVQQCSLPELLVLLQLDAHTILTQAMEWCMTVGNNACLEDCLIALYNILNSLNSSYEKRLLLRVKSEMECANFDKMIEGLSRNSQTDKIWRYLILTIDDFYSEESC